MKFNNVLKKFADFAEVIAIKANGMTSRLDSQQPDESEAVKRLTKEKNLSKKNLETVSSSESDLKKFIQPK